MYPVIKRSAASRSAASIRLVAEAKRAIGSAHYGWILIVSEAQFMRKPFLSMVLAVTSMVFVAPAVEPVLDEATKMSIMLPYATVLNKEIVDTAGKGTIDDAVELLAS